MRQSQLFTKTHKDAAKEEISKNAQFLQRAGFVHKEMAGVYAYLPLGLRVLRKITEIIREEMNAAGGVEIQMTALQDKALWEATGRWSDEVVDNWFKTALKNDTPLGLGFTHEEPITAMMKQHISSYRDLPRLVYQIQTKFRNELRAKSGVMRGREFLMKDLYSFARTEEEHAALYETVKNAYLKVYQRLNLGAITYLTFASGGVFSKFSHEFQTVSDAGEDTIYVHEGKRLAVNKEVYTDDVLASLGLAKEELVEKRAIEAGNIFTLGTRFSEPLGLTYRTETGETKPVFMGSYGIGVSRLMGTIVETHHDDKGMRWPESVAPFRAHLVSLCREAPEIRQADALYERLMAAGVDVLYDDRTDLRAGEKFADSDLIGIPTRVVVSQKTLAEGRVEVKKRNEDAAEFMTVDAFSALMVDR